MKNTILQGDAGQKLAFNKTDLLNITNDIASDIGYPSDSISFSDSKDLLVDIGNNFIAEILDCCKMMNCRLTPSHVKKALRLKFGIEVDGPVEDYTVIKKRNMEHEKVDEKLNR